MKRERDWDTAPQAAQEEMSEVGVSGKHNEC